MLPVVFKIGSQPVSSFGLFLLLAFLTTSYVIWRLIKVYEIDEEKTIDLVLLTFFGGIIFARIYFILFHLNDFQALDKIFLINRYPGLSFWGGVLGGMISLRLFSKRMKVNFYQAADIGIIGLFAALIVASFGCLLGSCQYGQVSNLPIAVTQIGIVGKRFPLQVVEAIIFLLSYLYLWRHSLKFHFNGQILSLGLIILGIGKFILEFFRGDRQTVFGSLSLGLIWSLLLVVLGIKIYYGQTKRSFKSDLRFFISFFYRTSTRRYFLTRLRKSWYNLRVDLKFFIVGLKRRVTKKMNIRANPTKFD